MMKKHCLKVAACMLTAALLCSQFSGCQFSEELTVLAPYTVPYEGDMGAFSEAPDVSGFASKLCVVADESIYQDSNISAEAALIFNITDQTVLFSKNAFEKLYPASITKLMTALVALKYGNLSDIVTVPEESHITVSGSSMCGVEPGDRISLLDLLYGALLPSGNDACAAIAVHVGGTTEAFVELMNQEAAALGATGTHFMNPHGLSHDEHYTTAYDIYLILKEVIQYETFMEIVSTPVKEVTYTKADGSTFTDTFTTTNWYLKDKKEPPENVTPIGGKTGTTTPAKYCLSLLSEDAEGNRYISVVLKARNRDTLYNNMNMLLDKIYE